MHLSNAIIDNPAYTFGGSVKSHTNAYKISRYALLPHVPLESSFQLTNRMLVNLSFADLVIFLIVAIALVHFISVRQKYQAGL